ncbi:NUDIX domain-containing protein [Streptomyces sp. HU2014]|uniref:NUDIX domain-containing protein n=1 Tax=Streptomyces sp. HU2014 TaxID=2939414 RepID=UPI00200EBB03|nr:NUDIX domain-containing protein [Streptomyces sp. HU2014]UQI45928.1 NUDIX domain-containing protein [Streptomyces sp. HU2014]
MGELVERVDDRDRVLGVVDRGDAVRHDWLHRVASTVCRDQEGRLLVHQRSALVARFPGQYEVMVGGAVGVGESYQQAAVRELKEELGVQASVRFLFSFLNRNGLSPHWLGVHEAVVPAVVEPDPREVSWHEWLSETELRQAMLQWTFTPDTCEVLDRYLVSPDRWV